MHWLNFRAVGSDINRRKNIGYHGCVGHLGTTTIPLALSDMIFRRVFNIIEKGGKA